MMADDEPTVEMRVSPVMLVRRCLYCGVELARRTYTPPVRYVTTPAEATAHVQQFTPDEQHLHEIQCTVTYEGEVPYQ